MMKVIALSASLVSLVAAQGLLINSPASLVECQPALITYSGGQGPFFISVLPGGQSSGNPLEQFPQQAAGTTQFTWNPVNLAAGTSITLEIRDNTGATAFSAPVSVTAGTTSDCVGGSASVSGATSGAPASSGSAASSGSPSSGASSAPPSSSAPRSSSSPTSAPASSNNPAATSAGGSSAPASATQSHSGASPMSVGLTGFALAVGAALLRVVA